MNFEADMKEGVHRGELITRALEKAGKSQTWLADQLDVNRATISAMTKRKSVRFSTINRISEALGFDILEMDDPKPETGKSSSVLTITIEVHEDGLAPENSERVAEFLKNFEEVLRINKKKQH